jgi:hypothetical protein
MADFGGGDTETFRKEARDWLAANFPAELRKEPDTTMEQMDSGASASAKRAGARPPGRPNTAAAA